MSKQTHSSIADNNKENTSNHKPYVNNVTQCKNVPIICKTQKKKKVHINAVCEYCKGYKKFHSNILETLDRFWFCNNMQPSDDDVKNFTNRKRSYLKYRKLTSNENIPLCIEAKIKIHFSNETTIFKDGSSVYKWYNIIGYVRGGEIQYTP